MEAACKEVFPDRLFEAQYIEEMIEDGFSDESRVLNIVLIFTLLSILVSALGLFAMSSYYMQQEIRSVSVKKVFGADYSGVLKELVLSFMKMVGIAFVIGVPIAWFIMNRWLSGYGHRIDLYWWIFALNESIQKDRRFDADQYPGYERRFCGGDDPDGAGALGYDL